MVYERFATSLPERVMLWWFKIRRGWVPVAVAAATTVLAAWVGGTWVLLPSLFAGAQQTVMTVFLPVPIVAALALSLDSRLHSFEATAIRALRARDTLLICTALGVCLIVSAVLTSAVGAATARNVAFLTGLMLTIWPWARQASVMIPVMWIAVLVFFSRNPHPDPDWWTVLPEPASAPHAAAAAIVSLAMGLTVRLRARPEQP